MLKEQKRPYDTLRAYEVNWQRHELQTGNSIGAPITLWPWAWNPVKRAGHPGRLLAALSPDDRMLALRDAESPGRLDVWTNEGNRIAGFYPAGQESTIDWIGWDPQNRLLMLCEGLLTAWEVPAAKAIYEIDGGYSLPVNVPSGGNWLAISAETHIDLIETATGKCIGRCATGVPGTVADLAVSPDGRAWRLSTCPTRPRPVISARDKSTIRRMAWTQASFSGTFRPVVPKPRQRR